jgi:acyl transferase domain-containing protein
VSYPGMAAALPGMGCPPAHDPAAQGVLAEFKSASGEEIARLVLEAGEGALHADRAWELAVVATELAFEAFRARGGLVSGALGSAIGVYAALLGAGTVRVAQAVAMIDTVLEIALQLHGSYATVTVTGPSHAKVEGLCRAGAVEVAAVLGESQVIVAAELDATERLAAAIAASALRVPRLPVRWPLHTTLMAPVAAALDRSRTTIGRLRPLRHPVYSELDGARITTASEGWYLLVRHLVRPQRLDLGLPAVPAGGFGRVVELGPGSTLARVAHRILGPEVTVHSFPVCASGRGRGARRRC